MKVELLLAKRYLLGKKTHHIINLIAMVSVAGVWVGSMALIIVLSVFNGFGNLVISLYDSFDPDIKITAAEGKTFEERQLPLEVLKNLKGVSGIYYTLEENALMKYNEKQFIVTMKGVDDALITQAGIDQKIVSGTAQLNQNGKNFALVGSGVAYSVSMNPETAFWPMTLYVPDKNASQLLNAEDAFHQQTIIPGGVFSIQQDFDSKYLLVPLPFARNLTGNTASASAVEVFLAPMADKNFIKQAIKKQAGDAFNVKDREEQHQLLYSILRSEKWAVFLILSFIMIIGIFNILGTLTMLVVEKKRDIYILRSMGASLAMVKRIFFMEGILITAIGLLGGLLTGTLICYLQQTFGFVKMGNAESFVVDAYPVSMQITDFLSVFTVVFALGITSSYLISGQLVKRHYQQ